MKVLLLMFAHLLTTAAKLLGAGGAKAIVADSLLMKQQLLIINRSRRRAPNLTPVDRMLLGFWSLFLSPCRIERAAVILRPSTLLNFTRCSRDESIDCSILRAENESEDPRVPHRNL